jgi:hypothetical protein
MLNRDDIHLPALKASAVVGREASAVYQGPQLLRPDGPGRLTGQFAEASGL